jgi:hypothetical protein
MEASRGLTDCNLVTVLMRERHMPLQEATDLVGTICRTLVQQMVDGKAVYLAQSQNANVRAGSSVERYFAALEDMVVGNVNWSFESKRFFGDEGLMVMIERVVTISEHTLVSAVA